MKHQLVEITSGTPTKQIFTQRFDGLTFGVFENDSNDSDEISYWGADAWVTLEVGAPFLPQDIHARMNGE